MKILFISPNPIWGGAATANLSIAKMLIESGHSVIYNDEYLKESVYDGIHIDHSPIHRKRFVDRSIIHQLVIKESIDIIIWNTLIAIYYNPEIRKFSERGIKQICIIHSLSLSQNIKGKLIDYLISRTIVNMSAIVYVSQYTYNSWNKYQIVRKSNVDQFVIYNCINQGTKKDTRISDLSKIRIGFVGRLSEEKQPEVFCLLSEISKYQYVVYGTGPMLDKLRSSYPKVTYKGLVMNVAEIYSNIDILVLTSKFENCPMVVLEAKALGIPCVAPCVGGIPEIVEDGFDGVLYYRYNSTEILSAIETVLSNYSIFSENCQNKSRDFMPHNIIKYWNKALNLK